MRAEDFMEGENLQKKKFSAEEIRACVENGDCAQCGLCCYAFVTVIPDSIPLSIEDPAVSAYVKSGFEFCKHLIETPTGLFQCACHSVKGHLLLQDCVGWEGNNLRGECSDYDSMAKIFQEKLMSLTQEQLLVLNRLLERGIIQFKLTSDAFTPENRQDILIKILNECKDIPHALLAKIEIKRHFKNCSRGAIKKFLEKNHFVFKELNTKQRILLKIYLPQVYLK